MRWAPPVLTNLGLPGLQQEKDEFVENILADIKTLGLRHEQVTYTSDYFPQLLDVGRRLVRAGVLYADDTPQEQMREVWACASRHYVQNPCLCPIASHFPMQAAQSCATPNSVSATWVWPGADGGHGVEVPQHAARGEPTHL